MTQTARYTAPTLGERLARSIRDINSLAPPPVEGQLTRMVGLTLEALGCQAAVGDRCEVISGDGAKVDVTPEDLAAVPQAQRPHTLLMRKVEYAPVIETTDGNFSKVEVRILFVWKDGQSFPVTTLARLSQGKMMGVNYNKDRTWVGSSGNLWPR